MNDIWKILGIIFSGVIAFFAMNGFIYSLDAVERWDYLLANAFLIIFIYLVYLTYEIYLLKEGRE